MADWAKFSTWDELADQMNAAVPGRAPTSIWALCLLPKISIQELPHLAKRRSFKNSSFTIDVIPKTSDFWLLTMAYKGQIRKQTMTIPLRVVPDGWMLLFTSKNELTLAKVLTRRLYPRVSRAHLTNVAFEELLRQILPSEDYEIKPIGCDAVTPPISQTSQGERAKESTRARLSGPETARLLDLIRDQVYNLWIDNLEFEMREKQTDEPVFQALLSRDGLCEVHIRPEAFDLFLKLLEGVVSSGRTREVTFSNMDRAVIGHEVRISPVRVKYHQPIETFQIKMITKDLIRRTITSVVHSGNPYFLAIAQDYQDKSTFSVAIIDNTLTIIPIKQNSDASFARLLDIVYGNIGEGEEVLPPQSIEA